MDPFRLFHDWHRAALAASPLRHPNGMCLATIDSSGAPDARFVDLKEVSSGGFVFCTHFDSVKSRQLSINPDVALTFWWDHVERQVRIAGTAGRISDSEADMHFAARGRDAQLTTWASEQSAALSDRPSLHRKLGEMRDRFAGGEVRRPDHWGGYRVMPTRFEFLDFEATRLHRRLLFQLVDGEWSQTQLQP